MRYTIYDGYWKTCIFQKLNLESKMLKIQSLMRKAHVSKKFPRIFNGKSLVPRFSIAVYGAADDERQNLHENVDIRIQMSTETLDHQHAENHAGEGSILFDSITNHGGK